MTECFYLVMIIPSHVIFISLSFWHLFHETNIIAGGGDSDDTYDDILEYGPEEDTITSVGHMIQAKENHAISVVEAAEYTKWCDGSI